MACRQKTNLYHLFVVIVAVNIAMGFSDGLFNNYYNDAYHVTATQRGLIEFKTSAKRKKCESGKERTQRHRTFAGIALVAVKSRQSQTGD